MMLPLMTEVDWVPRMAGIFYSLAFFIWLFVILKNGSYNNSGPVNWRSSLCYSNRICARLQCTNDGEYNRC